MINALVKGVHQLGDKKTQKPLWISIALALGKAATKTARERAALGLAH